MDDVGQVVLRFEEPSLDEPVFGAREQDVFPIDLYIFEACDYGLVRILRVKSTCLCPNFESELIMLLIRNTEKECIGQRVKRLHTCCHFGRALKKRLSAHDCALTQVDHRCVLLRDE